MLSKNNKQSQNYSDLFSVSSYNVKHYDDKKYDAVKELFENSTLLFIQETWLAESEFIRKFKNDFPESDCISANKMENGGIGPGRRYSGVGICYHTNKKCKIENVNTISKSICALKTYIGDICLLLINVYMPCSDNRDALDEYASILQEINNLCINHATQHIIIGGDWNADPNRSDGRTKLFKDFISQKNLFNPLSLEISNVSYTFSTKRLGGGPPITSTIDHFLITPNLADKVVLYEADTVHSNISDHVPLVMKLKIDVEHLKTYKRDFKPSVQWHKCDENNISNYKNALDNSFLQCNPYHEALRCK